MHIEPDTLRKLRERSPMSQDDLSQASGIGKKTIGEIERAKRKPNANTIKCLAKALKVTPQDLGKMWQDFLTKEASSDKPEMLGNRKLAEFVDGDTHVNYMMVEARYGIPRKIQIEMAPLLMALALEKSLVWRQEQLDVIDEASEIIGKAEKNISADYGTHLSFIHSITNIVNGASEEQVSIEKRDFFGRILDGETLEFGYDQDKHNPFADYLQSTVKQVALKDIEFDTLDIGISMNGMPRYEIGSAYLERLTNKDHWARYAITHGLVKISNIPKKLRNKENHSERVKWIADHVSPEKRKEIEDETKSFLKQFSI